MKVLIVNTSERTGGAAVAANRLMRALINNGVKAKMLVREKETDTLTVAELPKSPINRWNFLWERLVVFCHLHFSKRHLFEIDIANAGTDITKLREDYPYLCKCHILSSSDAHYLKDINEPVHYLHVEDNTPEAIISALSTKLAPRAKPSDCTAQGIYASL